MKTKQWVFSFGSIAVVLLIFQTCTVKAGASADYWMGQGAPLIKEVTADLSNKQIYMPNLPDVQFANCEEESFYMAGTHADTSDCITHTAFGYMTKHAAVLPRDSQMAVGLRSGLPYVFGLSAVPEQGMVMALTTSSSSAGSYIHFYRNILAGAVLKTDAAGQLYYMVTQFPDVNPLDGNGRPLQMIDTAAFSRNGAWMIFDDPVMGYTRLNLATQSILTFGPSFAARNGVKPQAPSSAISDDGRYAVIAGSGSSSLIVYDLSNCSADRCVSHEFKSDIDINVANVASIMNVHFSSAVSIEFTAVFKDSSAGHYHIATYRLFAPGQTSQGIDYLALGDSFASGQGADFYKPGTDTSDNHCHLSTISYPFLLAEGRYKNYNSVACSAATMNDIMNTSDSYMGQTVHPLKRADRSDIEAILANFKPGYIDQLDFVRRYNPGVITVSVGGNDIGFSSMMSECTIWASTCYEHYEDRLAKLQEVTAKFNEFVSAYTQLKKDTFNGRIYVIGYPHIVKPGGDCALNVHLNTAEAVFSEQFIDYLNGVIARAAQKAGVQYVDVSHALDGHRLCEASGAAIGVNGLTAGGDKIGVVGNESYHPNALGHRLIERTILIQTKNITRVMPNAESTMQNPVIDYTLPILQDATRAGTIGSDIYTNRPVLDKNILLRGETVHTTIDGMDAGTKANTNFTITLHSDPLKLGESTSDGEGNVRTSITIPVTVVPGYHTIHLLGVNQANESMDMYQSVYVMATQSDYDGDGITNLQDTCPFIANSGIDQDKDGIDDTCDDNNMSINSISTPIETRRADMHIVTQSQSAPIDVSTKLSTRLQRPYYGVAEPSAVTDGTLRTKRNSATPHHSQASITHSHWLITSIMTILLLYAAFKIWRSRNGVH